VPRVRRRRRKGREPRPAPRPVPAVLRSDSAASSTPADGGPHQAYRPCWPDGAAVRATEVSADSGFHPVAFHVEHRTSGWVVPRGTRPAGTSARTRTRAPHRLDLPAISARASGTHGTATKDGQRAGGLPEARGASRRPPTGQARSGTLASAERGAHPRAGHLPRTGATHTDAPERTGRAEEPRRTVSLRPAIDRLGLHVPDAVRSAAPRGALARADRGLHVRDRRDRLRARTPSLAPRAWTLIWLPCTDTLGRCERYPARSSGSRVCRPRAAAVSLEPSRERALARGPTRAGASPV